MFSVKDPVPVEFRSNVVYKFTCASCNSCYVGETSRHLSTRIREHLNRDRTSHIFQHLQQSQACRNSCSAECFSGAPAAQRATKRSPIVITGKKRVIMASGIARGCVRTTTTELRIESRNMAAILQPIG